MAHAASAVGEEHASEQDKDSVIAQWTPRTLNSLARRADDIQNTKVSWVHGA